MEEIKIDTKNPAPKIMVKPLEKPMNKKVYLVLIVPLVLGVLTGFFLYKRSTSSTVKLSGKDVEIVQTATEEGVKDASTFKDTVIGTVQENDGKLTTEGTHVLVREGGASQNVYLTTSVLDLSKYVGKKVQVWGETFQGQKAGWLMDVGRIKVQ